MCTNFWSAYKISGFKNHYQHLGQVRAIVAGDILSEARLEGKITTCLPCESCANQRKPLHSGSCANSKLQYGPQGAVAKTTSDDE